MSSNTPWFFNGLRIQYFPTNTLKIEPWIINGWQSYGRFNKNLGFGGQILWQPNENLKLVFNNYGIGQDNLAYSIPGQPPNPIRNANRVHTDDSVEYKYYDNKMNGKGLSKAAFSLTLDAGCEYGGGVGGLSCTSGPNKTAFLGWMLYALVYPATIVWALIYYGACLGGPHSATLGMRVMDLELRTWYGAPGYFVLGAMHAVLFWVSISFLTPFILLVGLFDSRRRMLHDIVLGTVVINASIRNPIGQPARMS